MGIRERILAELDENKIPCELHEHEAAATEEDILRLGVTRYGEVCKNLFLRNAQGNRHYLVVTPIGKHADLSRMKEVLGSSRLSFASPERLAKYLGVTPGSVTPLAVIADEERKVEIILDSALEHKTRLGFHPGDNRATVFLSFEDLLQYIGRHGNSVTVAEIE